MKLMLSATPMTLTFTDKALLHECYLPRVDFVLHLSHPPTLLAYSPVLLAPHRWLTPRSLIVVHLKRRERKVNRILNITVLHRSGRCR